MRVLESVGRDLSLGIRLLLRAPGFTATAAATLAIAIGANTAVFAVVNGLLLKPTPVSAPERLGRVDTGPSLTSWLNYDDIRRRSAGMFADVMASRQSATTLDTGGVPASLHGQVTSANFFTVLGVPPALGRTYTASDNRADVVVLSDHVWRVRFGSTTSMVGQRLTIGGAPLEVIGVMPRTFRGLAPPGLHPDFWAPVDLARPSRSLTDRALSEFDVVGRLEASTTHGQASAALRLVMTRLRQQHAQVPESAEQAIVVPVDGLDAFRGMSGLIVPVLAFLGVMATLSGFVLFIGCANVAGLLVGRATARQREIGVRLALGASRRRVIRQLLTESFVLAIVGGTAGLLLTQWLVGAANAALSWLPVPIELDLGIDRRVFGYAFGLSTLACLFFGLAPAWSATRLDLTASLKHDASSGRRQRLRRVLVAGQVATCTALLIWTGLFTNSLRHISSVDPGFRPDRVVVAAAELERSAMSDAEGEHVFVEWARQVAASPTVESAALSHVVPLALTGREDFSVSLESDGARRWVVGNRLTPGWFQTVGIPFLAGRDFTWDDRSGAPHVAIVNDTLSRQFFGGQALGQRLVYGQRTLDVVGVVSDSKYATIGEVIAPTVYLPFRQTYASMMVLHARTADMAGTAGVMVKELRRLAPNAVVSTRPMREAVAVAIVPAQIGAAATGVLGFVAMLLSAIGVYGLVSFIVGQRRREFAIRQALGGTAGHIVRLILGTNARLVSIGVIAGIAAGSLGAMALRVFLTGVGPLDPLTFLGAAVAVITAVALASLGPALRAGRNAPLTALRDQ